VLCRFAEGGGNGQGVVLSGTYSGQVKLYQAHNCQLLKETHGHEGPVKAIGTAADGAVTINDTYLK